MIALIFKADLVLPKHLGLGLGAEGCFFALSEAFYNPGDLFIKRSKDTVLRLLIGPNARLIGLNLLQAFFKRREFCLERLFLIGRISPEQMTEGSAEQAQ